MNDLQQIAKANAEAVQRAIPDLRARGNHVVAEYSGLNFIGTHQFKGDTAEGTALERATRKAAEINQEPGGRAELYAPFGDVDPINLNGGGSSCISDAAPCSSEPVAA